MALKHKTIERLPCLFLIVLQWLLLANRVEHKALSSFRLWEIIHSLTLPAWLPKLSLSYPVPDSRALFPFEVLFPQDVLAINFLCFRFSFPYYVWVWPLSYSFLILNITHSHHGWNRCPTLLSIKNTICFLPTTDRSVVLPIHCFVCILLAAIFTGLEA